MKIDQRRVGEVQILDLHGRMALGDGDTELVSTVKGLLAEGCKKIVLNLTDVPYLDSAGLGHTIQCRGMSVEKEAAIALVMPGATRIPLIVQVCLRLAYPDVLEDELSAVESLGR